MEQIVGLIIMLVIWGVISFFKKQAKTQDIAQHNLNADSDVDENIESANRDNSIEDFLKIIGGDINQSINNYSVENEVAENVEKNNFSTFSKDYSSISSYDEIEENFENSDNTESVFSSVEKKDEKFFQKPEKSFYLKNIGFDVKKAVVYSIILERKFQL